MAIYFRDGAAPDEGHQGPGSRAAVVKRHERWLTPTSRRVTDSEAPVLARRSSRLTISPSASGATPVGDVGRDDWLGAQAAGDSLIHRY